MIFRTTLLSISLAFTACSKSHDESESKTPTKPGDENGGGKPKPAPDKKTSGDLPRLEHNGKYAVLKISEGLEYHTGLLRKPISEQGLGEMHTVLADCENLPAEFDLRTLGTVPPIKDQGQCGSCWSFSKTGSLESALLASGKPYTNLSEQQLVSCDKQQYGCGGGFLSNFDYQIKNGQALETAFPYTASDAACKGGLAVAAKGSSFSYVGAANRSPTEKELKCALFKSKTIPWITVSASNAWSNPPASEKTPYTNCGNGQTNHAVSVVGWNKGGFIMKNSWGVSWGDKGYMTLALGCDRLADEAAFIMVEGNLPCKPPVFKLPVEITGQIDADVYLGVQAQEGVSYQWFKNNVALQSTTSTIRAVTGEGETIYKLVGKNACGQSESSVRVKLAK